MLVAPATDGEIGILTNHHPMVTKLGPGAIRIVKTDGMEERLFTSGGYLEFNENTAILLADVIENIDAIEAEQARLARLQAQELLKTATGDVQRENIEKELRINMIRERLAVSQFGRRPGGRDGRGAGELPPENQQ